MSELMLKSKKKEATNTIAVAPAQDQQPLMRKTAVDFVNPSPAQIKYLQRTMGNQAIRRAVQRTVIQRKMTVGPVGDKYEQEADSVAKQVVGRLNNSQQDFTQRQEEDEELQMMPIATVQRQEEEELQMKPSSTMDGGELSSDVEGQIQSAKGGGRPLDSNTQSSMGQAFNADFSGVNIHTNGQSDTLNRSLQARAFTSGQDIFFRSGEYNPNSGGGQELLAHELTHTIQQGASSTGVQQKLLHTNHPPETNSPDTPSPVVQRNTTSTIQRTVNATNFTELVKEQEEFQTLVKETPGDFAGKVTTAGFEYEFAEMTDGPLRGVSHAEVGKATKGMPYTGIPFILETDASNALELVTPPFLLDTIADDKPIPDPDEVQTVNEIIEPTVQGYAASGLTIRELASKLGSHGIPFELFDTVSLERGNMTPNTPDEVDRRTTITKSSVGDTILGTLKKGGDTHVNFATDAQTYVEMQEDYEDEHHYEQTDNFANVFLEIERDIKDMIQASLFKTEVDDGQEDMDQVRSTVRGALAQLSDFMTQVYGFHSMIKSNHSFKGRFRDFNPIRSDKIGNHVTYIQNTLKRDTVRPGQISEMQAALAAIPSEIDDIIPRNNASINTKLISFEKDYGELSDKNIVERTMRPKVDIISSALSQASDSLDNFPIIGSSNSNLKTFAHLMARTLSGQLSVVAQERLLAAQKARFGNSSRKMGGENGEGLKFEQYTSSRVKDVNQVWIKDTLMNIGLGILTKEDWKQVQAMVSDDTFKTQFDTYELPETLGRRTSGPNLLSTDQKKEITKKFRKGVKGALGQMKTDIKSKRLLKEKKHWSGVGGDVDLSGIFMGPSSRPDLFTHDKKHIGARQDTYLNSEKVQMPGISDGKRLHVVESRMDTVERLRKLKEKYGRREPEVEDELEEDTTGIVGRSRGVGVLKGPVESGDSMEMEEEMPEFVVGAPPKSGGLSEWLSDENDDPFSF